jgi:transcriptional regulator with XRE-family HTH domain
MNDHGSIIIDLSEKLQNREYRRRYFLAEASARIAEQLILLRRKRRLHQKQVADLINTKQPAISRVERADYHNWSFNTLRAIADALDARISVSIQPTEDILHEYDVDVKAAYPEVIGDAARAAAAAARNNLAAVQSPDHGLSIDRIIAGSQASLTLAGANRLSAQ